MDGGGDVGACAPVLSGSGIGSLPGFSGGLATDGLSSEAGLSDLLLENGKQGKVGIHWRPRCTSGWRPSARAGAGQSRDTAPIDTFSARTQARKPYTISKARERWSEEEHQRFVEAVRLHGRAWRKIEGELGWVGGRALQ